MFFAIFCQMFCQIVLAGERPLLWTPEMTCQEVQAIMESKRGRRRGDLYTGRCDPNMSFENAPRPWDIVRLLDEQRPSLEACVIKAHPVTSGYYSANFKIIVYPPGTSSPQGWVAMVNSTAGENGRRWFTNLGGCIMDALEEVTYPATKERYSLTWRFNTLPSDEDILNLDGILTVPEVERLEPEIEGALPP